MAKRKKKHSNTSTSNRILTYIAWTLALVALILTTLLTGYYLGYEEAQKDIYQELVMEKKKDLTTIEKEKEQNKKKVTLKQESLKNVKLRLKEVLKKELPKNEIKSYISASHEYDDSPSIILPPKREIKRAATKAKLSIIIDDVSTASHVNAIKSLNMPLTMSFLPPSKIRPHSASLASKENFYMVHLPMEATRYRGEEDITLRVKDSQKTISRYISDIKKVFPKVRYINNHTGSKFTSNEKAMNRLINALNENKISFIDSRTTAQTMVPKVMKNFGFKYVARDIFLDHHHDKKSVKKQIKEAIRIAKLHGTAIAIGHPHSNTLSALRESKDILKDVELVYINRLN